MKDYILLFIFVALLVGFLFVTSFTMGVPLYYDTTVNPSCDPSGGCVNNTNPVTGASVKWTVNWTSTGNLGTWTFEYNQTGSFVNQTFVNFTIENKSAGQGIVLNGTQADSTTVSNLLNNDNTFWNITPVQVQGPNVTIFNDSANSISANWTNTADGDWTATTTNACVGTSFSDVGTGESRLNTTSTTINTTGYMNTSLVYTANTNALDGGEFIKVWVYDGASWTLLYQRTANLACTVIANSTSFADNVGNFNISFDCLHNAGNGGAERCTVDDIALWGQPIVYSTGVNFTTNATTIPASRIGKMEIDLVYKFNGTADTWSFDIYNFTSGNFESAVTGTVATTKSNVTLIKTSGFSDYVNSTGHTKLRFGVSEKSIAYNMSLDALTVDVIPAWEWSNYTYTTVAGDAGKTISGRFYANDTGGTANTTNLINVSVAAPAVVNNISSTQSLTLNNNRGGSYSGIRSLIQSMSVNDQQSRMSGMFKSLTQSLTANNNIVKIFNTIKYLTQSITDNLLLNTITSFIRSLAQSVTGNNLITSFSVRVKLLTQSITDNLIITTNSIFNRITTLTVTINNDAIANLFNIVYKRAASLSITISNSILERFLALRTVSVSIADNLLLNTITSFLRSLSQSVTDNNAVTSFAVRVKLFTQSVTANTLPGKISILLRFLSQSITDNTITGRLGLFGKSLSLTITQNISLQPLLAYLRQLSQSLTDNLLTSKIGIFGRTGLQSLTDNLLTVRMNVFGKLVSQSVTDNTSIGTLILRVKLFAQSITGNTAITSLSSFFRQLSQSITDNNLINSFSVRIKSLTQSITEETAFAKLNGVFRLATQSFTMNSIIEQTSKNVRLLTQSITSNFALNRFSLFIRNFSQTLTDNTIINSISTFFRTASQAISDNTLFAKLNGVLRTAAQSMSINDALNKTLTGVKLLSQSISSNTGLATLSKYIRTLSQTITGNSLISRIATDLRLVSQSMTETTGISSLRNFFRSLTQGLTENTALSQVTLFLRQLSQTFTDNTLVGRMAIFGKSLTQSMADNTITSRFGMFGRLISQDITNNNLMNSLTVRVRLLSQSIIDNVITGRLGVFGRQISQAFSDNLAINSLTSFFRTISQSLTGNNLVSSFSVRLKFLSQSLSTSMTSFVNGGAQRLASIGLAINNSIQRNVNFFRNIQQNISPSVLTGRLAQFARLLTQAFNLNDLLVKLLGGLTERLVSIGMTLNNALTESFTSNRPITQSLSLNTITSRFAAFTRLIISPFQTLLSLFTGFIGATPSPGPSPLGSVGGGGGVAVSPISPPATGQEVDVVSFNVLKEVSANRAAVTGMTIKNTLGVALTNLKVEVSGVPEDWVSVYPDIFSMNSSEEKTLNLVFSVPNGTEPGDYKVEVKVKNQETLLDSFFIMRVRSSVYDRPVFYRNVELDRYANKTNVQILADNPSVNNYTAVEVIEDIPKILANSSDEIEFITTPTKIIRKDPLIQWNLFNFSAGETRNISYSVNKVLEDFSTYIYSPLEQANFINERIPRGIRIIRFYQPDLVPGETSTLEFELQNLENEDYNFTVSLTTPQGWKVNPNTSYVEMASGESKRVKFEISVPSDTKIGTYMLQLNFKWDSSESIKEFTASVGIISKTKIILIVLGSTAVIILGIVSYFVIRKKRLPMLKLSVKYKEVDRRLFEIQTYTKLKSFRIKLSDIILEIKIWLRLLRYGKRKYIKISE